MVKRTRTKHALAIAFVMALIFAAMTCLACSNIFGNHGSADPTDDICIVVFYEDGGSSVLPQKVHSGDKIDRPSDPTRNDYRFDGWYTSKQSDGNEAYEWDFDTDLVETEVVTLYAWWTYTGEGEEPPAKEYCKVTFVTNCSASVPSQTVEKGDRVSEPPTVVNDGYIFAGWYTDSGFADGTEWNFNSPTTDDTLVLYANWTKIAAPQPGKCAVTFVTNCAATVDAQHITEGGKVSEPPALDRNGYTFGGWYTDPEFSESKKWNFNSNTVSGAALTLYAKWTPNGGQTIVGTGDSVTATFNIGLEARKDGLSNPPAVTVKGGSTIAAPTVARSGYTLTGWYVENGTQKWDFATDTLTANTTLFAKWQAGGNTGGGTSETPSDYVEYTPTHTTSNHLYIHYFRTNGDYDGWTAWVWTTGKGLRYVSVGKDVSGTIIDVDLSTRGNPTSLNFKIAIISESESWGEEDGDNCALSLSDAMYVNGSYHWFVRQGNTGNGKNYLSDGSSSSGGGSGTEEKRASISNVDRSYAKSLPVMKTVDGWDEMGVGYQIFVASFCDSNNDGVGDIRGIINKLDYLQSLNVDVLWLTPIQSSDSYHGYDCYDYYFIDPKFGSNADYRELVYKVHQRGMKIIMDLVVNHTSRQNEWFIKSKNCVTETVTYQDGTTATVDYRDFYRWKNSGGTRYHSAGDGWYYYSSFNESMPELNYDYQPVRDAMVDVAAYWMNYGLDGFRMDAIKHIFMYDESVNESGDAEGGVNDNGYNFNMTKNIEFFKEFNYKLKTKYPHCFLLGEQLSGNTSDVSKFYAGMDSLFDFNTYYDMPDRLNGGAAAQAAAFNSNAGKYNTERQNGRPINSMISSNHDIERLNYKIGGDTEKAKLYMAVIMTMPGLSWIYYGDEIGLVGDKNNNKGDDGLRQSMKWTSSWANKCNAITDYQINNGTKSVAEQESDSTSLLSYVKSLTKLRNDYPVLINGTATCSEENGMLKISVTNGAQSLTVYHNFSSSEKTVSGTPIFGSNNIGAYGTTVVR